MYMDGFRLGDKVRWDAMKSSGVLLVIDYEDHPIGRLLVCSRIPRFPLSKPLSEPFGGEVYLLVPPDEAKLVERAVY